MDRIEASVLLVSCIAWGCGRPTPIISPSGVWQRSFEDQTDHDVVVPEPSRTTVVSLHGILAYADKHAPAIAVARAGFAQSYADKISASLRLPSDPTVSMWAGPRTGPGGTAIDVGVSLQQQFALADKRGARLRAAKSSRGVREAVLSAARRTVHLRVHLAFHLALLERERVKAARKLLAFSEQLLVIARKRLAAGDIAAFHVKMAQGEVALAKQKKTAADAAYTGARLTLAQMSGWPVDKLPVPAGGLDKPRRTPPVARLVKTALRKHPGLRTLLAQLNLAAANVRVADRNRMPNITLGLSYAQESEASAMGTSRQHIALLNLSLPLPLFRNNTVERVRSQAQLIVARSRHRALRQTVEVRVRGAAVAVNSAVKQIEAYGKEIVPTFEANLTKLSRAFALGEIDVLQVLVARGRFLEIQQQALNAYATYFRAAARLEAEVGDEVWPDEKHEHTKPGGAK